MELDLWLCDPKRSEIEPNDLNILKQFDNEHWITSLSRFGWTCV